MPGVDQARRQIYSRAPEVAVLHENRVVTLWLDQMLSEPHPQK
jgi:hypothetical protein